MRALRELRAPAIGGGPPAAVVSLLRAFYYGKDAQSMTGSEYHAIVAALSQRDPAHADLEDKLLLVRTLGDKKVRLVRHIRDHCGGLLDGAELNGGPSALPAPQTADARCTDSRQSMRSSHPEYAAGGLMSALLYPSDSSPTSAPRRLVQALPEGSRCCGDVEHFSRGHPCGEPSHHGPSPPFGEHGEQPGRLQRDRRWQLHQHAGVGAGGRVPPSFGQPRPATTAEAPEQLVEQLQTQVAALTALLHQGVEVPLPQALAESRADAPASVRVWYGSGAGASGRGWQWAFRGGERATGHHAGQHR